MGILGLLNDFLSRMQIGHDVGVVEIALTPDTYQRFLTEALPMLRFNVAEADAKGTLDASTLTYLRTRISLARSSPGTYCPWCEQRLPRAIEVGEANGGTSSR